MAAYEGHLCLTGLWTATTVTVQRKEALIEGIPLDLVITKEDVE